LRGCRAADTRVSQTGRSVNTKTNTDAQNFNLDKSVHVLYTGLKKAQQGVFYRAFLEKSGFY